MGTVSTELIDALTISARELQQGIQMHCGLMTSLLEGKQLDENSLQPLIDRCPKRSREVKLEKAIGEAIQALEESRKSFKSKRLEILRKKLTRVLIEAD
jgi:predicted nucleotide-binding protein (sugar kinase/HSP70/actin superfamily)